MARAAQPLRFGGSLVLALGLLLAGPVARAQPSGPVATGAEEPDPQLTEAVEMREKANQDLVGSQERIDELSDETDLLLTRYQTALRQIESLDTYNRQLEELVASQDVEAESLHSQLDRIEVVTRDVTPLMLRMIDALDAFVELDVPFLAEERRERIEDLRRMMRRADISESEKYRRIMEAYQIENEYGRTIEAYRSTLDRDGRELTVDMLRVGRIALLYQTLDENETGMWNQRERAWQPLADGYGTSIRQGLRVARKQSAPDMLSLPLPLAEQAEGAR